MPSFQTKALVVTPISGDNFRLIPPNCMLIRHVCSSKAEFSFLQKKTSFLMLFQTCTILMFGLPDVFVVTVIARNRINGIGSFIEMRSFQTF